jgi:hypothetical protein
MVTRREGARNLPRFAVGLVELREDDVCHVVATHVVELEYRDLVIGYLDLDEARTEQRAPDSIIE